MALETSPEQPAPVRQIANAIAGWIDRLGGVWVEGQIAQISRRPGMATVFMTLRDSVADISLQVTAPRHVVDSLATPLTEGASVVINAKPSYYANRGTLSLYAREIRPVGLGALLARLEQRRQLLAAEGLFAAELKRPLPFLPHTIGLVTAANSAAERDVLENVRRRWPGAAFRVIHAPMQGTRCVPDIVGALERLDTDTEVDVIVIARGGGSVEDLLPFSDEALIRAVHRATTAVVSAIGHEPDSPLLDLVADLRASTPTDAAKRVVPDVAEELALIDAGRSRARAAVHRLVDREQAHLDQIRSRPAMADPRTQIDLRLEEVAELRRRSRRVVGHRLDRASDQIHALRLQARALSPLETLRRGYAVAVDADGHLVSAATTEPGQEIMVRVADGRIWSTTTRSEADDLPDQSQEESDE
ncbi:exodeoxyribonuclease VII large subunit [Nocardioides sp. Kera G14]|uniref:exodeoxyribonuclease VII large subunit n=1 Tax=Nocardioides sp. Kera G14 TaxID=2884264 RepID=UPI001D12FEB1|nr:exodeoxyribonuclease VII large subunit [Nocardioides sp. Kera G14]UDY22900.1 exodeoxyribonuclease VII large subunit [Nocardioides sp. Kera G14]